jgi:glycosyltransferase involved in cell wall biosynthesis
MCFARSQVPAPAHEKFHTLAVKILAVTNMYPSAEFPSQGGFVREQIKGLRAAGLKVRVLFADRRREGPMVYFNWLRKAVRKAIAEFEPDVIHAMYGGVMADQIARRCHVRPVVVTFRGSDLLGENLSGSARKIISRYGVFCSRRAARAADGVVVVAHHLVTALKGSATPDKVRVIPSGIDLDRIKPMDSRACKRKLGWSPQSFHVLFASNNSDPVKRPELAKAAVAQVRPAAPHAEFHQMTRVSTAEVPLWLNAADALLLTSAHEGSPNIVKEALACGLPVVSVNVGDVAERIEGIEGCFLAAPQPADLAAKLELVRQHGRRLNCRTRLEELSSQNVADKLKQFYHEITRQSPVVQPDTSRNQFSIPVIFSTNREIVFTKQVMQPQCPAQLVSKTARHQPAVHHS